MIQALMPTHPALENGRADKQSVFGLRPWRLVARRERLPGGRVFEREIVIYWRFPEPDGNLRVRGDFMSTLTITLSDDRLAKLLEIANRFNIKPEDLARFSIEELLTRPDESFQKAADYILHKNAELYRRLA